MNELSLKKYDFLSLKTTLNFLRFVRDDLFLELAVDCSDLDLRDKNTWELFSNHLLTGVFQLDTPSARNLLTKFCPNSFSELVLFLALNKPKTTSKVSRMIFLKENKSVPSISECFREIVVDTGYCVVFEEQVSQIISLVYKCSFSEAELKRKNFEYILLEKNAFINEIKKKNTQLSTYETN